MSKFGKAIAEGYATAGPAIELGRGVHEGVLAADAAVRIPLAMMNRHGLIAGATGTGKTRTLQLLAEAPAPAGPPDIGDFLRSRQGQQLQRKVLRGVFGMLRKRL